MSKVDIVFDNNVWDLLSKWDLKLKHPCFSEHFNIIYPKVIGVEHDHVNTPSDVKKYKDQQLQSMDYDITSFFGFADQPASSGFGQGFMADESDMVFIESGHEIINRNVPFPKYFADQTILALADRHKAYVVTMDNKKPFKKLSNVISLKEVKDSEMTVQQLSSFLLSIIDEKIKNTSDF